VGFNEHLRYILPAFPFFFIFTAQTAKSFNIASEEFFQKSSFKLLTVASSKWYFWPHVMCFGLLLAWRRRMALLPAMLVASLSSWLIASSLWVYPHSLSYFNESIGGPMNGPAHLLGSNVDWGQDLRYVAQRVRNLNSGAPLMLAYFGPVDPASFGIAVADVGSNRRDSPTRLEDIEALRSGNSSAELAISVNLLFGPTGPAGIPAKTLDQLRTIAPSGYFGYSIRQYRIHRQGGVISAY
jgi:hypothetical protein